MTNINKNDIREAMLHQLQALLDYHRAKCILICQKDCLCCDIDSLLMRYEKEMQDAAESFKR